MDSAFDHNENQGGGDTDTITIEDGDITAKKIQDHEIEEPREELLQHSLQPEECTKIISNQPSDEEVDDDSSQHTETPFKKMNLSPDGLTICINEAGDDQISYVLAENSDSTGSEIDSDIGVNSMTDEDSPEDELSSMSSLEIPEFPRPVSPKNKQFQSIFSQQSLTLMHKLITMQSQIVPKQLHNYTSRGLGFQSCPMVLESPNDPVEQGTPLFNKTDPNRFLSCPNVHTCGDDYFNFPIVCSKQLNLEAKVNIMDSSQSDHFNNNLGLSSPTSKKCLSTCGHG